MTIKATTKAIVRAGGATQCAKKLQAQEMKIVTRDQVQKWLVRGVPPAWIIPMETLTGVSRHELNSKLYPKENKKCHHS